MQLNPGPENTYWINLEAETELDPTTPSGNIAAGCYLLGKYMQEYGDANKEAMAYNILNAAEVWGCDWTEIRDAKVWAAPGEKAVPMPTLYK